MPMLLLCYILYKKHSLGGRNHRCGDNVKVSLNKSVESVQTQLSISEQGPVVGSCGHGNEPYGSIKTKNCLSI
jgi:hypothetical protein